MSKNILDLQNPQQLEKKSLDVKEEKSPVRFHKEIYTALKIIGAVVSGLLVFFIYNTYIQNSGDFKGSIKDYAATTTTPLTDTVEDIIQDIVSEKNVPETQYIQVQSKIDKHTIEAGESLIITSSQVPPKAQITFVVEYNEDVAEFSAYANTEGIATAHIPGDVFTDTGKYKITVKSVDNIIGQGIKTIAVKPQSTPSTTNSLVVIDSGSLGRDGSTTVTVTLVDQYTNVIKGHVIKLISTADYEITPLTQKTNAEGIAVFDIKNTVGKDSTISVLDTTSGVMLSTILQVKNTEENTEESVFRKVFGIETAYAQTVTKSFIISEILPEVNTNTQITFVVEAVDSTGQPVENYTGTITFISTDTKAELPTDYTFKTADKGEKQFIGKLTFITPGTHTFTVMDKQDNTISGSTQIRVLGTSTTTTTGVSELTILYPLPNAKLDSQTIEVLGNSDPNTTVELFDDTINLNKTAVTGSDGVFFLENVLLTDGAHKLIVKSGSTSSVPVPIIIDTEGPDIDAFTVTPDTVPAEGNIDISLKSESGLKKVEITLNTQKTVLVENLSEPGTYTATITAPSTPGLFTIDLELVDQNDNATMHEDLRQVTVTAKDLVLGGPEPSQVVPTFPGTTTEVLTQPLETTPTGPAENFMIVLLIIAGGLVLYREWKKERR